MLFLKVSCLSRNLFILHNIKTLSQQSSLRDSLIDNLNLSGKMENDGEYNKSESKYLSIVEFFFKASNSNSGEDTYISKLSFNIYFLDILFNSNL